MTKPVILFLAANPEGTSRVALDEECAAIERELEATPGRGDFELCSKWAVTFDDVMRQLNKLQPTILHFSGHGNTSGIMLHGGDGSPHPVAGDVLANMLDSTGASARVVVLNACFTDTQAQPLAEVVGCAVGMSETISDDAAREFSIAFYRALGHRCSAYRAFHQAQVALAGYKLDKHAAPRCITRADVDASALFLVRSAVESPPLQRDRAPTSSESASTSGGGIHVTGSHRAGRDVKQTVVGGNHVAGGAGSRRGRGSKRG